MNWAHFVLGAVAIVIVLALMGRLAL